MKPGRFLPACPPTPTCLPTALLPRPIRGIIPPMITPLLDAATLDDQGLARLIEHILAGGVHGLFVLGTTGEGPSLPYALRRTLVSAVCALVRRRVPVLVGITDTAHGELIAMARHAADAGASAVVVAPPPYFTTTQSELLGYLQRVAAALPLPVILYNMPSHTKVFIEAETVRRAADSPNVIGLKDSSGNLAYFHQVQLLLSDRPDFTLLVGPEELLAGSVLLGGHGGVNGGANVLPELYVSLFNAAAAGDLTRVRALLVGNSIFRGIGSGRGFSATSGDSSKSCRTETPAATVRVARSGRRPV